MTWNTGGFSSASPQGSLSLPYVLCLPIQTHRPKYHSRFTLWATQSLSSLALQRSRNGTDAKAASISELSEIKKPSNFQKNCRSHLCHICLLCVFWNFLDALTPMQKMSLLKVFKESHGNFPNSATRIVRR